MKLNNIKIKKTKIIATAGPSFGTEDEMRAMFKAGVNVVRLNTSHGTIEEHNERVQNIKKIRKEMDLPISIMLDTQGPEIRVHKIQNDKMKIRINEKVIIYCHKEILGKEAVFSINYKNLANNIKIGQLIMIDDGKLALEVEKIEADAGIIFTKALNNHYISTKKSVNVPGVELDLVFINERDEEFIKWGIQEKIDYVAASFVRDKNDIKKLRKILKDNGGEDVEIISKIESLKSIKNLTEIIHYSDAIMFARGDLGVEIPFYQIPYYEKMIINKCRARGKSIIIATQMLDSMINNPRPTRAEVTDIYYAVDSGADAVMLSGESASGNFPLESVETMSKIAIEAEKNYNYTSAFESGYAFVDTSNAESSFSVAKKTITSECKYIIALSEKGRLIKALSRFRPNALIIALIKDSKLINKTGIDYAVYQEEIKNINIYDDNLAISEIAKRIGIKKGSNIIVATKREFKKIEIE